MTARPDLLTSTTAKPPPGWKSPFRNPDGTPIRLFQTFVEQKGEDGQIAVTPAIAKPTADHWFETVKVAIKTGKITGWANPQLVQVT